MSVIYIKDFINFINEKARNLRHKNFTDDYVNLRDQDTRFKSIINSLAIAEDIKQVIYDSVADLNNAVDMMASNRGMAIAYESIIRLNEQLKEEEESKNNKGSV